MKYFIILMLLFSVVLAYAGNIPEPPTLSREDTELRIYLKTIKDNLNNLEILTSNPDGSRKAKAGDSVIFNNSGTYYLEFNIDGGTTWKGIQLSDTP